MIGGVMADFYVLGQGIVSLGDITAETGLPGALAKVGNVPDGGLTFSAETNAFDHRESQSGKRRTDLKINRNFDITGQLTVEDITPENLATFFKGENVVDGGITYATIASEPLSKEYWLDFQGLNNADNDNPFLLQLYRVVFGPPKSSPLIGSELFQIIVDFQALFQPLLEEDASHLGGYGRIGVPTPA